MPTPPAKVFQPDKVAESELAIDGANIRKVRSGLVTNVSGDPATALEDVLDAQGMPALGSSIKIKGITSYLRSIRVRPLAANVARVLLIYDAGFGGTNTALYIRSRGYLSGYQTNLDPSSKAPLRVSWVNPNDPNDKVPEDSVMFSFMRSMREVSVTGIKLGAAPLNFYEAAVGYANGGQWNGLPAGYWVVTEGSTDIAKYAGYYQFSISALTKNTEDWSEFGVLRNSVTGRYVKVKPQDMTTLKQANYSYGTIATVNGAIRVGPFPTTAFVPLFGF